MRSRVVQQMMDRENRRQVDRSEGRAPVIMRFSASMVSNTQSPDVAQLPCIESEEILQNADGTFKVLAGYSAEDGPDS